MQAANKNSAEATTGSTGTEPGADEVRAALQDILASQPFRTSRQCQRLLHYIVDHSLKGEDASLRERVLGVEVFERSADYDTAEDPVVRMRAADVRKRLAQFYQGAEPQPVHIDVKPGSYRAAFRYVHTQAADLPATTPVHPAAGALPPSLPLAGLAPPPRAVPLTLVDAVAAQATPAPSPRSRPILLTALLMLALTTAAAVVGIRLWAVSPTRAQKRFWAPLIQGKQPVLLYLGSNVAYRFTPGYLTEYQRSHGLHQNGPEFFPTLPPNATIRSEDLIPAKSTFVTLGDLAASTQIVTVLNSWSRPFVLRSGDDLSIGDVRNTPAIFIGGFNNRWSLSSTDPLPLGFRDGNSIIDRRHSGQKWLIDAAFHSEISMVDYALVSRVSHSETGGPVLELGGIGSFGTQAAAEFVSSPEKIKELLNAAPKNWNGENMQAVLRIQVVGYAPVKVDVVKTVFW